jgi:hypothetical protein
MRQNIANPYVFVLFVLALSEKQMLEVVESNEKTSQRTESLGSDVVFRRQTHFPIELHFFLLFLFCPDSVMYIA